jgi:hypothetical protein
MRPPSELTRCDSGSRPARREPRTSSDHQKRQRPGVRSGAYSRLDQDPPHGHVLHRTGKPLAERSQRIIQWRSSRRLPEPLVGDSRTLTGRAVRDRKTRVDKCHRLDLAQLHRDGALRPTPGRAWRSTQEFAWGLSVLLYAVVCDGSEPAAVVLAHKVAGGSKRSHASAVELTSTPCNYGGSRLWFRCPLVASDGACRRRCRTLFLPFGASHFGCRECHRLTYRSRQQHRNWWYESVSRSIALQDEEVRRPVWTLSSEQRRRRRAKRKRVNDALKRFNERREFQ